MLALADPATARVLEGLGADTLNVPGDLGLAQLAAMRAAVKVPIDVYVESGDELGGFVRSQGPELIRVAAPLYVKLGLRNAYPWGRHLEETSISMPRERVRRARLVLERRERAGADLRTSKRGRGGWLFRGRDRPHAGCPEAGPSTSGRNNDLAGLTAEAGRT